MVQVGGLEYTLRIRNQFEQELRQFRTGLIQSRQELRRLNQEQLRGVRDNRQAITAQRQQIRALEQSRRNVRQLSREFRLLNRENALLSGGFARSGLAARGLRRQLVGLRAATSGALRGTRALITAYVALEFAQRAATAALLPLREALDLQQTLENAEIGIRSILLASRGDRGLGLEEAGSIANVALQRIQEEAANTSVSVQDLVEAVQVAFGVGLEANLGLEEIIQISRGVAQATLSITGDTSQVRSELRALFGQGRILNAQVAQAIEGAIRVEAAARGVDVTGLSLQQLLTRLRQVGQLGPVLVASLEPFNEAGQEIAQTLAGIASNLRDIFQIQAVAAFEPLFVRLTGLGLALTQSLSSPQITNAFRIFGDTVLRSIDAIVERFNTAFAGEDIGESLREAGEAIVFFVGVGTDVVIGLVTAVRTALPIFGQLRETIEALFGAFSSLPDTLVPQLLEVQTIFQAIFGDANLSSVVQNLTTVLALITGIGTSAFAIRSALIGLRALVFALAGPFGVAAAAAGIAAISVEQLRQSLTDTLGVPLDSLGALEVGFLQLGVTAARVGGRLGAAFNLVSGGIAIIVTQLGRLGVFLGTEFLRLFVVQFRQLRTSLADSVAFVLDLLGNGLREINAFTVNLIRESILFLVRGLVGALSVVVQRAFDTIAGQLRVLEALPGSDFLGIAGLADNVDAAARRVQRGFSRITTGAGQALNVATAGATAALDELGDRANAAADGIREAGAAAFEPQLQSFEAVLDSFQRSAAEVAAATGRGLEERQQQLEVLVARAEASLDQATARSIRDARQRAADRAQAEADAAEATAAAEERLRQLREEAEAAIQRTARPIVSEEDQAQQKAFSDFEAQLTRLADVTSNTLNAILSATRQVSSTIAGVLVNAFVGAEQDIAQVFGNLLKALAQQLFTIIIQALIAKAIVAAIGSSTPAGAAIQGAQGVASQVQSTFSFGAGGFAEGGEVPSYPGRPAIPRPAGLDSRDTVPAWLQPHEFVQPVKAVQLYGRRFMEALRAGAINPAEARALAANSSIRRAPRASGGFQTGGAVVASAVQNTTPPVAVVVPNQAAASRLFAQGDRAFFRFVRENRDQIKSALG